MGRSLENRQLPVAFKVKQPANVIADQTKIPNICRTTVISPLLRSTTSDPDRSLSPQVLMDLHAHVNPVMRSSKGQLMTPLDSALYRGNRGCAKYLQLHGGVPASTLTDKDTMMKALSQ